MGVSRADKGKALQDYEAIKDLPTESHPLITEDILSFTYSVLIDLNTSLGQTNEVAEINLIFKNQNDVKRRRNALINSMHIALGVKCEETQLHSSRINKYSDSIARQFNLSINDQTDLDLVLSLHDIGKLSISNSLLEKDLMLTEDEWVVMKTHCLEGYNILKAIPEFEHLSEYILFHHERWDGTGYPNQLKGNDIPLISRIMSVVDAYDAMTHDRCYRKAMTKKNAIFELIENSGTQFDPEIVKSIVDIFRKNDK